MILLQYQVIKIENSIAMFAHSLNKALPFEIDREGVRKFTTRPSISRTVWRGENVLLTYSFSVSTQLRFGLAELLFLLRILSYFSSTSLTRLSNTDLTSFTCVFAFAQFCFSGAKSASTDFAANSQLFVTINGFVFWKKLLLVQWTLRLVFSIPIAASMGVKLMTLMHFNKPLELICWILLARFHPKFNKPQQS